jgi:glutamyl-tRNA synthetase
LQAVATKLAELTDWTQPEIHQVINDTAEALGVGMGKIGMPLRVAVTGGGNSPALDITLALIGKARTLARLEQAISFVQQRAGE